MEISIISKNYGSQKINTETFVPEFANSSSTVFKIVEHIFNEWYDKYTQSGAPMAKDIEGMYYGEGDQPAIYSKKGAIREGIANLIELAMEDNISILTTKQIMAMDIEATFI